MGIIVARISRSYLYTLVDEFRDITRQSLYSVNILRSNSYRLREVISCKYLAIVVIAVGHLVIHFGDRNPAKQVGRIWDIILLDKIPHLFPYPLQVLIPLRGAVVLYRIGSCPHDEIGLKVTLGNTRNRDFTRHLTDA